jgi:cell wall-associated NlpC family hydrolase
LKAQQDIIAYARETLGTPYLHQGRVNQLGLDCIGVAIYVANRLGVEYVDLPAYGQSPYKGQLKYMMQQQPCLVEVHDRQPGDLFLMKFVFDPQHVAVFTGDTIIHCSMDTGRVVEHHLDAETSSRIVGCFRFTMAAK